MYECCGRSFEAKGLRQHLDNSYAHSNEIECHWCFARWPTHDGKLRLKHEQKFHWLKCKDCNWKFSTEDGLQEHIDEEHSPNYCYGCQRSFQSPNNLNQHLKSSVHVGKNVKCPWCTNKFTNLTGVCLHLESGSCTSGINRDKINQYCREVDPSHIFTNKQIGWHDKGSATTNVASQASWDGSFYRCYFCPKGFDKLSSLNQHLASPAHERRIYHCPRCKREYIALSGLVNHMESESCGAFRFGGNSAGLGFVKQLRITQ
ncbi:MAG: hypothetical protein ASARMPRED_008887 [Alectoria sarmentosa]|nr:MAG: hypothetical protein ASARMPRED_008887 [Alectoria sarmentosa]